MDIVAEEDNPLHGSILRSIATRADLAGTAKATITRFKRRQEEHRAVQSMVLGLESADRVEVKLMDEILRLAPIQLHESLRKQGILERLFKHGRTMDEIQFGKGGFLNFNDAIAKLKLLEAAWKNIVKISRSEPKEGRMWVWFSADS
jgi:hypothetical protein